MLYLFCPRVLVLVTDHPGRYIITIHFVFSSESKYVPVLRFRPECHSATAVPANENDPFGCVVPALYM